MSSGSTGTFSNPPTGNILAASDIHGYGHLLALLLDRAAYDPRRDKLFLLGDYVNKGPDSAGTLERIRRLQRDGAVALQGNNERKWLRAAPAAGEADAARTASLMPWMASLPLWAECGPYVFVHAGLRPGVPLRRQTADDLTEIRDEFHASPALPGQTVVFGHTSTFRFGVGAEAIWFGEGKIGIDTGAGHGHYVSLVDLSNGLHYYVSVQPPHDVRCITLQGRSPEADALFCGGKR
ncbi:metallophosphoesterase [Paenibacillus hodogayensis]|uniref:Metallophosphoesterase n=1 Tax=Paenibacillus hodogayensis TaxID=279208 RepID=A0ABV5VTN0_9BACL